jgi:hypothetical protein
MVGYRSNSSRVAVVVVGILLAAPAVVMAASAGDPAAVAKVTDLNKQALAAYSQQDYETAKNLLKQALQTCADAGLDQHPITARTHLHFGAVAIVGFKQRDAGIKQFKKALEIQPDIKLTKSIVTPELQDAFEQAVLASNGGEGGSTAAGGEGEAGGGAAAEGGADNAATDDEDDHGHRPKPKAKPRKKSGDEEEGGGEEGAAKGAGFYLGLTLGSGAGIASGSGHVNPAHKLASAGFASGQLGQVEPQVGYFLDAKTLLSLAVRLQYVSGTNGENGCGSNGTSYCNPTTFAVAALARATWFLGVGPLHWTVGGQVGAGYIAHALSFPTQTNCGTNGSTGCVDAVLGGAFLIGPTAGLWYDIGDSLGLIAAVNSEIGAPKFTVNFDIDVGLGFRL